MKKLFAILLASVMVLSLAACGEKTPSTEATTTAPETTAEPTTTAPETEVAPTTTEAVPDKVSKLFVLNNIVDDLTAVKEDPTTRYNAYWLDGYSIAKIAEENFWYMPADDEIVHIYSHADLYEYAEELTFGQLKEQYICLNVPEDIVANYPEGLLFGTSITKSQHPYNLGYIVIGNEALVLMREDGYVIEDLFSDLDMIAADSYQFVAGDGYTECGDKDELDVEIFYNEKHDNTIDFPSYDWPGEALYNIRYIAPEDYNEETKPEPGVVCHITIVNNAEGVLGEDPEEKVSVFGGTLQEGYKVQEILDAAEIPAADEVTYIAAAGTSVTEAFDKFAAKYIVAKDSKDRQTYAICPGMAYGEALTFVNEYVLGDNSLIFVPYTAENADTAIALKDYLTALGFADITGINVVCADGYNEEIDPADLDDVKLYYVDGKVDSSSIAYPTYTLADVAYIEISCPGK